MCKIAPFFVVSGESVNTSPTSNQSPESTENSQKLEFFDSENLLQVYPSEVGVAIRTLESHLLKGPIEMRLLQERDLLKKEPIIAPDGYIPNSVIRKKFKLEKETPRWTEKEKPFELKPFKRSQEASIHFVEGSYSEKLQEIRDVRKKLNADLDGLENSTLKELDTIRSTLQTSLKQDIDNCNRLKDELQQLSEAVQGLCDKNKKDIEFIASRKCLDKIHKSERYLKENPVKVQSSMIFKANIDIDQYLTKQSNLGKILILKNPNQVLNVERKSEYNVKISSDTRPTCNITSICSLPSGHVIVVDNANKKLKLLDEQYNVSGHCDVADHPHHICPITSNEVAVTFGNIGVVQYMSVSNGQLVEGRKLEYPHRAVGIAHHQGALYITSGDALYHYTLTGDLIKILYEDRSDKQTEFNCAVSPTGDRIYVTVYHPHKLLTLTTDGTLLSLTLN